MPTAGDCAQVVHSRAGIHDALLYRADADYVDGVLAFLERGLLAGDACFVAVPRAHLDLLEPRLPAGDRVQVADMIEVGRNPARIIPAIQQFLDLNTQHRVSFVGEPIWPGRSAAEICEATRHEAMLNTVFADQAVDILCPYAVDGLDSATVNDAWRTHPGVVDESGRHDSASFAKPAAMFDPADPLLPPAPDGIEVVPIVAGGLPSLRERVRSCAAELGLAPEVARDLVLAANEIATNTLMHTAGSGTLRIWREPASVICEIRDGGHITDALAGRRRPADDAARGRGLWMANHLCDLVQWRSTELGTIVRLHVGHPEI